jgi:hypothetical protein
MLGRRLLIPLALALFAVGCADSVGVRPTANRQPITPHLVQWGGNDAPLFSAVGSLANRVIVPGLGGIALSAPHEISLDQNVAQFWAVRGEERSVQINYKSSTGDITSPFLRLVTSDPIYAPAQGELAQGDSVLITVTVDPQDLRVTFEPSGLQFGNPSEFQVFYGGAGGDLNGDGAVDASDAEIEHHLLGLWYRQDSTVPWTEVPAVQSLSEKSFSSELKHFTEYAVSWLTEEEQELLDSDYAVSW